MVVVSTVLVQCPEARPFSYDQSCVTECPKDRPFADEGVCVEECPLERFEKNENNICGNYYFFFLKIFNLA